MASFLLYRSLERLSGALHRAGSPIRSSLRPGLADADVRAALRRLDLVAPYQLVDLYAWADGLGGRPAAGPHLVWLAHFPPLAESVAAYRLDRAADSGAPREWFPVLVAPDGGRLSVQCGLGAGRGTLWWSRPDGPVRLFDSLCDAVDAAIWCVETGEWQLDGAGRLSRRPPE
jgi:hypothetical protein